MSQVINNINSLKKLDATISQTITSGISNFGNITQQIEQAHNSGNLEPENYAQLMSSQYLGSNFQQEYYQAYQEQLPKMQHFLNALEKKLNEYLQIS